MRQRCQVAPASVAAKADVPGGLIEFDDGNVPQFGGLGLEPSPRRSIVRGEALHIWCALDSPFIPEIIGESLEIVSRAPISGEEVQIVLTENGPMDVRPAGSVMTFATPEIEVMRGSDSTGDVQVAVCDWAYIPASEAEAAERLKTNNGPDIVPAAEVYGLARPVNAVRFAGVAGW